LSDERISQLRRLPKDGASANDVLAIVDISASQTKKIQLDDLVAAGVDLIPAAEIDLDKLDQNSTTKLDTIAIASGAITAAKLGDDSSVAVQTTAPAVDNFVGRGFFDDSTGNWQVFNGSEYQQVVMPSGGIGDLQVTTEKLAAGAVTTAKVSPLGASAYATGSVGTAALADGGVTAAKIASGTITSGQIATGSITGVSLGSAVVTYDKLQDASEGNVLLGRISGSGTYEEIPLTAAGRELLADATAADQRESLGLGTLSTADGTWEDGSSFSGTSTGTNTGDQTITLTGDVAGTGTGSFATTIANDAITEAKVLDGAITENKIGTKAVAASKLGDNSGVIVATSVPVGDGAFVGQQWVNTNTGWEYTWTGSAWQRLQSVSDITFANSSPLTFSATLTDPFTAEITVGQTVQQATTVLAGPTTGEDAAPTYRALLPSDLPVATADALGVNRPGTGLAVTDGIVNHSNAVSSGVANGISFDNEGHITATTPLSATDIPDLDATKITTGEFSTARYSDDSVTGEKLADYSTAKIGETLPVADYTGQIFFNPLAKSFFLWDGNVWQPIGISFGAIIFAGTYNASGNTIQSVTSEGAGIGLTVGSGLPSASSDNTNYYLVVSIGGVGTAPAPENQLDPPDLIISNGTDWLEIDVSSTYVAQTAAQVGFVPAGEIGSTTVQAAIEEVSDECRNASNITAGTLAVARGGTNLSSYTKGDLIVASGSTTLARLPVGSNGQILEADSAAEFGVKWIANTLGTVTSVASTTVALVVASGTSTTAPSLSIASASTTASGIVMLTNSTSTSSSVLAATATAVKTVADVANGALQASGSTSTGPLRIGTTGSLLFEGSVDNGIRTTLTAANPTAARTITLPNETGTVITSAGNGVVTSTMILDGTIVNADISASAAIVDTKLATISTGGKVSNSATTATASNTVNAIVARNASGNFSAGTITANLAGNVTGNLTGTASAIADNIVTSAKIVNGTIVNADISNSAAIGYAKLSLSGSIVNADINASAAIVDTKLATIATAGKVSNSATTATASNTVNAIVARNASGNFSAGTITASLTGAASLNVLKAGDTLSGVLTFAAAQTYPKVPQNSRTSAYTLIDSDAGKHISITTGGVVIPSSVFGVGDVISVFNNSGSNQTITQGAGTTLRLAGTATTGNRTVAQFGLCSILCVANNVFVINGAGVL
jgi:trimeric autotransporter adhesin